MVETILAQIMTIVLPVLVTSIGVLITWGLNEGRKWVKTKSDNEAIDTAFNQLNLITTGVVKAAEQSIKEAAADGKITTAEAYKIKTMVVAEIRNQLPKSTEKILTGIADNINGMIDSKVEEAVFDLKKEV
jgi:hypothetical protein